MELSDKEKEKLKSKVEKYNNWPERKEWLEGARKTRDVIQKLIKSFLEYYKTDVLPSETAVAFETIVQITIPLQRIGTKKKIENIDTKLKRLPQTMRDEIKSLLSDDIGCWGGPAGMDKKGLKEKENMNALRNLLLTFLNEKDELKLDNALQDFIDRKIVGVKSGKLSPILYCLHPDKYPVINDPVIKGCKEYFSLKISSDLEKYLEYKNALTQIRDEYRFDKNFRDLDAFLFFFDKEIDEEKAKIWKIAPGAYAEFWSDCLKEGIICMGWGKLGDLSKYQDKKSIKTALRKNYGKDESGPKNVNSLWRFAREIRKGNIIIANKGRRVIVGIGKVRGDMYQYNSAREEFRHTWEVEWIVQKELKLKWNFPSWTVAPCDKKFEEIQKLYLGKYPELKEKFNELQQMGEERTVPSSKNFWWITANPHRWKWETLFKKGEEFFYGERIKQNFEKAKIGEPVIGYSSHTDEHICAVASIKREIHKEKENGHLRLGVTIQPAFEVPNQITWDEIKNNTVLKNSEPVKHSARGTLFKLKAKEWKELQSIIIDRNPDLKEKFDELMSVKKKYEINDLVRDTCIQKYFFENIEKLLSDKKQIIFYGPPGTSKTFVAEKFAKYFVGTDEKIEIIQFHPSYSYEDFIEGIKPVKETEEEGGEGYGEISYEVKPGIFREICKKAISSKEKYVLIIDEINRGDLARIFGELIFGLEYRDRGITLPYSSSFEGKSVKLSIPNNFYIIGTMNTADRSIAFVDYALRRRFAHIRFEPNENILKEHLSKCGDIKDDLKEDNIISLFKELNKRVEEKLGKDKQIGHTYFMPRPKKEGEKEAIDWEWLRKRMLYEIIPLLNEYCYENSDILQEILGSKLIEKDLALEKFKEAIKELTKEETSKI